MTSLLRRPRLLLGVCLLLAFFALVSAPAVAQNISGHVFTTFANGTTVNGNIYPSKDAVYLNGGPQNTNSNGLPDGTYYFQVTDPSGKFLLSTDDVTCRQVIVSGGIFAGNPFAFNGTLPPSACTASDGGAGNFHTDGAPDAANGGSIGVQLCAASGCPAGSPDFLDTPNHGGEYKVWFTNVNTYDPVGCASNHGFCDGSTKTDNFKVRPPNSASITACKFIDVDGDSLFNPANGDFLTSGWQITATGVDGGTVTQTTDQDGCTSFTFTFPKGGSKTETVTLTEVLQTGFNQVAPTPVSGGPTACSLTGSQVDPSDTCSVTDGVITLTVSPNDIVIAPFFGNALGPNMVPLEVSKTAVGGNNFNWNIAKSVDKTQIDTTNGTATFNYTVTVSHDGGTGWQVSGNITVTNPNTSGGTDNAGAIDGVTITDTIDNGGACNVNGTGVNSFGPVTINGGGATLVVPYTCTFAQNPVSGINTVSVSWDPQFAGGGPVPFTAPYDFSAADTSVTVTDSLGGNLGSVNINNDNSTSCATASSGFAANGSKLACNVTGSSTAFTYSLTFSGDKAGTCSLHNNTASFATNTAPNTPVNSNTVSVRQCVGEDVQLSKTATATFTAGLHKSVNQTQVEQSGGNITFNYTVNLTSPVFLVSGTITVTNPNDWESITVSVSDTIDSGGTCVVTGGSGITIPALGSSGPLPYVCTYTTRPTLVSGVNTANANETGTTDTGTGDPNIGGPGIVPGTPTPATAPYTFPTLTITDNVQSSAFPGGCNATLGTVSVTTTTPSSSPGCGIANLASTTWGVFTYSITDANASPGACASFNNTAQITGGASSNQVTVTVCNTNTGALTMGFWQNKNGQGIITSFCGGTSGTNLDMFLRQFNPFQDLSATATCSADASYVLGIIKVATCTSTTKTCNTMLRAQMLSTALDVYFSTPSLGGNRIGAFNGLGGTTPALGGVAIDLSKVCIMLDGSSGGTCTGSTEDARPEFGIAPPALGTTVLQMLFYSDFLSGVNGSPVATSTTGATWYNNNKSRQVPAKDAFDSINNMKALIAPPGTTAAPSF